MQARIMLRVLLSTALSAVACAATAQVVNSGGSSLSGPLYQQIAPSYVSYTITGSGKGKRAFLEDEDGVFALPGTVHFAASESVLTQAELQQYAATFNVPGDPNRYGDVIQIPAFVTAVAFPFNKPGWALDLNDPALCGIFSGRITDWAQLPGSGRIGPLRVYYRAERSGATELLTRFLASNCLPSDTVGTTLVNATFQTTSEFRRLFVNQQVPSHFIAPPQEGDGALYTAVQAVDGSIGYTGTDVLPAAEDATRVARVRNFAPNEVSLADTLAVLSPPTGSAAVDPRNWMPVFPVTHQSYPVMGLSGIVIGQCYKNATIATMLRVFLLQLFNGNHDYAIAEHGHAPLPLAWRNAIRTRFVLPNSTAGLNNASTCAGIGRP